MDTVLVVCLSQNMATPPLPNIPAGVLIACLQEYGAYLYQWQAHAESQSRELQSLHGRNSELSEANDELRDCRDILQRMVDVQRELVTSLEGDLARVCAERQFTPCACDTNGLSSSSTLSPMLGLAEINSHTREAMMSDPGLPVSRKLPADADLGGPSKKLRMEESEGVEMQLAELLRS